MVISRQLSFVCNYHTPAPDLFISNILALEYSLYFSFGIPTIFDLSHVVDPAREPATRWRMTHRMVSGQSALRQILSSGDPLQNGAWMNGIRDIVADTHYKREN